MAADDVDFGRLRAGGDAADALQHVENGFGALIGNRAVSADDFADKDQLPARELRHAHLNPLRTGADLLADGLAHARQRQPLDARRAVAAESQTAIGADGVQAVELVAIFHMNLQHVGAGD